jgi:hypothetical protein
MNRILVPLFALVLISSCNPKEEEQEPDYDHMVMLEDDEEWLIGDRKSIIEHLPDPQEIVIIETPEPQSENTLR